MNVASAPTKKLIELYGQKSKHSAYQVLAPSVAKIIGNTPLDTESRHEVSRLDCITSNLPLPGSRILDIGGNTGFFTFSALENGASHVDFYEGNRSHARFVETCASALNLSERVRVYNEYYEFVATNPARRYDVCFCLNVVHHVGDDFGDTSISIEEARRRMITCVNNLALTSSSLALQIGFNWKGDVRRPLFANGFKAEAIEFVSQGVETIWEIVSVHIAETNGGNISYSPVTAANLKRSDDLGEFLNRPLFFLKSKIP